MNETEQRRLRIQNHLLEDYENAVLEPILRGKRNFKVLDLGCSTGEKTFLRFSGHQIGKVLGLEYHQALERTANERIEDSRFSFYCCNIEAETFPQQLRCWMKEENIESFDLIYLSFVLMHLKKPDLLLKQLRSFLRPGGRLLIVDMDDSCSSLFPDPEHLMEKFLYYLLKDPLAGDRHCAGKLPAILKALFYEDIQVQNCGIIGKPAEESRKRDMFQVFLSYLPEDLQLFADMPEQWPAYEEARQWVSQNCGKLQALMEGNTTRVSMGVELITCVRGSR